MGEHHTNHCEDYAVVESLGKNKWLCAVMDGCTMGRDSYFASTLVGKLLRKIALEKSYQAFYEPREETTVEADVKEVLGKLMAALKEVKSRLLLKDDELLTTLILAVLDTGRDVGQVIVVGDVLVGINGQLTEYEHNNLPDYLGYHLGEDFERWYGKQKQVLPIDGILDISLSTDGIFTFSNYDRKQYPEQKDPLNYLLTDTQDAELDSMLTKKFLFLAQQCGIKLTDDLGIIRIIKNWKI